MMWKEFYANGKELLMALEIELKFAAEESAFVKTTQSFSSMEWTLMLVMHLFMVT